MRTLAWLNAPLKKKPPPPDRRNRKKAEHDDPPITRREQFADQDRQHPLPDPGAGAYLLDVLRELGMVQIGPMGRSPLGFEQLQAWQSVIGVRLTAWEAVTLCKLSWAYCDELVRAEDPQAEPPGGASETPEQTQQRRDRVSKGLQAALRSMSRK